MVEVLVPLSAFALTFGMWYIYITARNKERLALIEKGETPDLFKTNSGFRSLKLGLFLIGVAIGVIAGYFLKEGGMDEGPAFLSMIFLFGGIALVITHFLEKKKNQAN